MRRLVVPCTLALVLAVQLVALAGGLDPLVPGQVVQVLDRLGITTGGAYTAPVSGNLGATDNAVLRANGTGGASAQGSSLTVADSGQVTWPTGLGAISHVLGPSDQSLSIRPGAGQTIALKDQSGSTVVTINTAAGCSLGGNILNGNRRKVFAFTTDVSPTDTSRYWSTITNVGASGAVNVTAEPAVSGIHFVLTVEAAQYLKFTAASGDVISGFLSGTGGAITTSATAGYVRSNVVGSTITLEAIDATTWRIEAITGTWTIDS